MYMYVHVHAENTIRVSSLNPRGLKHPQIPAVLSGTTITQKKQKTATKVLGLTSRATCMFIGLVCVCIHMYTYVPVHITMGWWYWDIRSDIFFRMLAQINWWQIQAMYKKHFRCNVCCSRPSTLYFQRLHNLVIKTELSLCNFMFMQVKCTFDVMFFLISPPFSSLSLILPCPV